MVSSADSSIDERKEKNLEDVLRSMSRGEQKQLVRSFLEANDYDLESLKM